MDFYSYYKSKSGNDTKEFDPVDFIASLCSHIPNENEQYVRSFVLCKALHKPLERTCKIKIYAIQYNKMRYIGASIMPMSLRLPPKIINMIEKAAIKDKKTKTAFVIEAINQKLGLVKNRESALRDFAGWLSKKEAEELRLATAVFEKIQEGDWK